VPNTVAVLARGVVVNLGELTVNGDDWSDDVHAWIGLDRPVEVAVHV